MRNTRYVWIAAILFLAESPTFLSAQNAKEIMSREPAKLVETLKSAQASVFEKAKACQRLAVVGAKDAIPSLVPLLADSKLNLYARFALEGIPDPAVDQALREATKTLRGRQLVGVLDSIGQRKDAQAVGLLDRFLADGDPAVASAAAGAMGRIGTPAATEILRARLDKQSPVKTAIADACLACAEGLAATGKKAEAVALDEAVAKSSLPKHIQVAALLGRFRIQGTGAKDLLLAQIDAKDEAFFNLGLAVARQMPGADVTAALAARLEKLSPKRQALLLRAGRSQGSGAARAGLSSQQEPFGNRARGGGICIGQAWRRLGGGVPSRRRPGRWTGCRNGERGPQDPARNESSTA